MTHSRDIRVLLVGGTGMLGHKVWQTFRDRFDAWVTVRDRRPFDAHEAVRCGSRAGRSDC